MKDARSSSTTFCQCVANKLPRWTQIESARCQINCTRLEPCKAPARARKSGVSLAVYLEPNELMTRNTGAAIIYVHKLPLFLASRWL